jgi:FkbM family methyltransferase
MLKPVLSELCSKIQPLTGGSIAVGFLTSVKWYYEFSGIRGVSAATSFRLLGRPRELSITPPKSESPVFLRLSTSDVCSYRDVLICQDKPYDPRIPDFNPRTIVDIGAHIGMASLLFAHRYPTARIIAVEPEPANFAALVKNVFPYRNIAPVQAALWKDDGDVGLGKSTAHSKGAFAIAEHGEQRVRAVTMDTLMKESGLTTIDFLKIDIEGAEKEVFQNCAWIKNVRVIAIELHDRIRPGCRSTVESAVASTAVGFRSDRQGEVTFFVRE